MPQADEENRRGEREGRERRRKNIRLDRRIEEKTQKERKKRLVEIPLGKEGKAMSWREGGAESWSLLHSNGAVAVSFWRVVWRKVPVFGVFGRREAVVEGGFGQGLFSRLQKQ